MVFYLQVNEDNIITDCIDYSFEGYIPWIGTVTEPIHGGWYKYENGEVVEYPELKPLQEELE